MSRSRSGYNQWQENVASPVYIKECKNMVNTSIDERKNGAQHRLADLHAKLIFLFKVEIIIVGVVPILRVLTILCELFVLLLVARIET